MGIDVITGHMGWFLALMVVGAAAAAGGRYLSRIRRLKANERRLARLVEQRTAELQELTQQLHVANDLFAELAAVDGLTNIANRRRFEQYLGQEWQRATRGRTPLSLLLLDVDEFKQFNDTYGHLAGDRCLQSVAEVLRAAAGRPADLPARFGGEEFAVVLPETPAEGARVVAESIRANVASLAIPHSGSTTAPHVTVSIGVATLLPSQGTNSRDLVADCDRALYQAKQSGRNRSVVADQPAE